jgi:TfoX/Sxy family transcriptional regulator of competence genes
MRVMAYDEDLAARVREEMAGPEVAERRMFGGLAFLLGGNMACCVTSEGLMVRVGPDGSAAALAEPGVGPLAMGERVMKGWVLVAPAALATDDDLGRWVQRGSDVARSLPAK